MSWLKNFGQVMTKVASVAVTVSGFEPLLKGFIPQGISGSPTFQKVDNTFNGIVSAIGTAEVMITAISDSPSGADKLKAAAPLIAQLLKSSEALSGKTPKDPVAFEKAVIAITSATADLLNSY